MSCTPR